MKSRFLLLLLVLNCALYGNTSAQTTRYPLQKAADIDTLFYLSPVSSIYYKSTDGKKTYDPDLNAYAQENILAVMDSLASRTKLASAIPVGPEHEERISAELIALFDSARRRPMRYHDLTVPPLTDSILTASGKRYVMLLALRGKTFPPTDATADNRRPRHRIVFYVGTPGLMVPVNPGVANDYNFAKLDVMIIDVPRHYIYYNKFSPQLDGEPTARRSIAEMYRKALGRLFWPGSSTNY